MSSQKKVFVGLSGGVDSSVAALRLKQAGHTVVGVFIKTWHPDFIVCNEEAERLDAMRVAANLGIPFLTFDAERAYKDGVADYMIAEYAAGRTPNPDVMCNKYVKFGAFLDFALAKGADAVATGHYARIEAHDGVYHLHRGKDSSKDQSYFLSAVTPTQLAKILFPIGDTSKDAIRKEANAAGLPTATKADSQGICFLGDIDLKDFLSHYITVKKGIVLDTKGEVIGEHDGALFYTLGERHGFTINTANVRSTPHYVVAKDMVANTITVAPKPPMLGTETIELTAINEIQPWAQKFKADAQFRYRQKPFQVLVTKGKNNTATVEVVGEVERPSAGQTCVLYQGEECLGGGVINA